ncbi:MAG TPA: NADH-quinone oxidoreductase subunit NuoH [Gemmatimonadaceae bacterium]|nr:NADH-quinone oxidoreductase subunit NuoH [Gemmatimonadaceae bacterium]
MSLVPFYPLLQLPSPEAELSFGWFVIFTVVKVIAVFFIILIGVAFLTLAERRISAWIQDRHGPNRVGPQGLLQPAADGLKNIMKEETYPAAANKTLFVMAPALALIPAMLTFAVIPFASPWASPLGRIDMVVANLPIGFLYILALASLGVYGIVIAGWASNNKYSLLGGLRASAQMVSYEIALGMSTVAVLLLAGNVALNDIIWQQATTVWNAFGLAIAFFIFFVAALAETNRLPFDMPEAESELIAGYHTEYSAMKFSMFFIAEYANIVTASALMVTLFFGGWDVPGTLKDNMSQSGLWTIITGIVFFIKVAITIFVFMWIRWTLPRFRYDQLMSLGWKVMLPLALVYIVIIAGAVLALDAFAVPRDWRYGTALIALNAVCAVLLFFVFDRGRLVSPASSIVRREEIARLRARSARGRITPATQGD